MAQNKLEKPRTPQKSNDKSARDKADEVKTMGGALPGKAAIKDLGKDVSKLQSDAASIRGQLGSLIKTAESDHNIHRGAFRKAVAYLKMDPEKREEELKHLRHYLLAFGVAPQADLFDNTPTKKRATGKDAAANDDSAVDDTTAAPAAGIH